MKNRILMALFGFNVGVIGTVFVLFMSSHLETGSSLINYLMALGVGVVLAGIGYFVGGQMA
jgi:hypothetical protein